MESIALCPACGAVNVSTRPLERRAVTFQAEPMTYAIVRCGECKSEFCLPMQPAPVQWYHGRGEFYGWRWEFTEALRDLQQRLAAERARVLEVGCGEGLLLARLAESFDAYGVDINGVAVERARQKGLKASSGGVEELNAQHPHVRFDAVLLFHVLEHVGDPAAFLSQIRALLEVEGLVALSVPNPDRAGILFGREDWDHPPHHLSRFSRQGLCKLLARAGFSLVTMRDEPAERPLAISSMLANGILRHFSPAITGWSRPARVLLKSPLAAAVLPIALYERRRKSGVALYVLARAEPPSSSTARG